MADESMSQPKQVFLSAEWRDLVMLNYQVDPGLLSRYIPPATSLDSFQGETYISLVGFRFCRTRLLGYLPVPFHTNFDEVNLRFYVRREVDGDIRRGVVFVAEIVPRRAIVTTARLVYGENYKYARMRHRIETGEASESVRYEWQVQVQINDRWCRLSAQTEELPAVPQPWTLQAFITEHYWGYSAQSDGGCLEYHVSHTPHGECGQHVSRALKATQALFMGENLEQFFNVALTPRSWPMVHRSSSSRAREFYEAGRPRI
jgi:uncharacterized protein YqjF (DUF2071 family)